MSRSISADFYTAIYAQETDKILLTLIEITHPDLAAPLRLVNNTEAIVSDGETYYPYWFSVMFPEEDNGRIKEVRLVMDNTDRQLVIALRSITSPATINVRFALASSPDVVEVELAAMSLRNVSYDVHTVSGELVYEERVNFQIPALTINPVDFPGAWQ